MAGCDTLGLTTPTYTVETTVTPSDGGSVRIDDGNTSYADSSASFEEGRQILIEAQPSEHWRFTGWTGDIEGSSNPREISVSGDMTVTATYERKEYSLEVSVEGEGEVREEVVSAGKDYPSETEVRVTAVPDTGWTFVEWQGDIQGSDSSHVVSMNGGKNIQAVFERRSFPVTVNTKGEGRVDQEQVSVGKDTYPYESTVRLTATADTGWVFSSWEGDLSGSENPAELIVAANNEVTAVFRRKDYQIATQSEGAGEITTEQLAVGKDTYPFGSKLLVTAVPDSGWALSKWSGDLSGQTNPQELVLDGDKSVKAHFTREEYTVMVTSRGQGTVDWTPRRETYYYGDEITLTADPDNGYYLAAWDGIAQSSHANPITLTMEASVDVEAVFRSYEQGVTSNVYPGVIIGSSVYQAGMNLQNDLPGQLTLERLILKNGSGDTIARSSGQETIASGGSIAYSVDFTFPPSLSEFNDYVLEWHCEYDGDTFIKEDTPSGSSAKTQGAVPEEAIQLQDESSEQ